MEIRKTEKVCKVSWKDTIRQIEKGQISEFEVLAEDANRVRVAACELNREYGTNYSISIVGNVVIVKYE